MTFYGFYYLLILVSIFITVLNGYFLYKIYKYYPALFKELGEPSAYYFIGGGWLTSFNYPMFLLGRKISTVLKQDLKLLLIGKIVGYVFILLLVILAGGLMTALGR